MDNLLFIDYLEFLLSHKLPPPNFGLIPMLIMEEDVSGRPISSYMDRFFEKIAKEGIQDMRWYGSHTSICDADGKYFELMMRLFQTSHDLLQTINIETPFNFLIFEFPIGILDACTTPVQNGFLILLNAGLPYFLGEFTKLQALTMFLPLMDKNLINTFYKKYNIEENQLIKVTKDLIWRYSLYANGHLGDFEVDAPPLSGHFERDIAARMRAVVLQNMELFVIFHEYIHAMISFSKDRKVRTVLTPVGEIKILGNEEQEECECDRAAVKMLINYHLKIERQDLVPLVIVSVINLFLIFELIGLGAICFSKSDYQEMILRRTAKRFAGIVSNLDDYFNGSLSQEAKKTLLAYFSYFDKLREIFLTQKYSIDLFDEVQLRACKEIYLRQLLEYARNRASVHD